MSTKTRMVRAPPNARSASRLFREAFFMLDHSTNLTTNMEVN